MFGAVPGPTHSYDPQGRHSRQDVRFPFPATIRSWGARHGLQGRVVCYPMVRWIPWFVYPPPNNMDRTAKMGKDAVRIPDEVHPLVERMANQLSEQVFPGGMPWGTKFDHLETLAAALGDEIARRMIQGNVRQQAATPSQAIEPCPTCGCPGHAASNEPRKLDTTQGTVDWVEPGQYCPHCRRAFFPSESSSGTGPNPR